MLGLAMTFSAVAVFAIVGADAPFGYTFQWRVPVAVFLVVACVWAVATAIIPHAPAIRIPVMMLAVAAVTWGSVAMTVAVIRRPTGLSTTRRSGPRPPAAHRR